MNFSIKNELTKNLKNCLAKLGVAFSSVGHSVLMFLVLSYKAVGALFMGGACRFYPSCSDYAVECLDKHEFRDSFTLIFKRVLSCRPGGRFGYDPVPPKGIIHE